MATLADDVCAVLDAAEIESAHLVGFSMGGLVAQALAAKHPQRVDRLILASTYAVMNPQARMFLDAVRDVVLAECSLRAVFPLVAPWLFSIEFLADPTHAAWFAAPDEDDDELPAGWLAQYQAQRDFDGRADLASITAATLVLSESEDRLVSAPDATELTTGIAGATASTYEGSGHLINVEKLSSSSRRCGSSCSVTKTIPVEIERRWTGTSGADGCPRSGRRIWTGFEDRRGLVAFHESACR